MLREHWVQQQLWDQGHRTKAVKSFCLEGFSDDVSEDAAMGLSPHERMPLFVHEYAARCEERTRPSTFVLMWLRLALYLNRHAFSHAKVGALSERMVTNSVASNGGSFSGATMAVHNLGNLGFCLPVACVEEESRAPSPVLRLLVQWVVFSVFSIHPSEVPPLNNSDLIVRRCCLPGVNVSFVDHFRSAVSVDVIVNHFLLRLAIIEFPKSGRTWLSTLVTYAAEVGAEVSVFGHIQNKEAEHVYASPFILMSHGEHVHGHPSLITAEELSKRFTDFVNSHPATMSNTTDALFLFRDSDRARGVKMEERRTVLLVRDPLDVHVSNYYERKHRAAVWAHDAEHMNWSLPSDMTLEQYTMQPWLAGSLATYVEFLNRWVPLALADPQRVLVVHYEALHECPVHVLHQIMNSFLKLNVPCAGLRNAVERSRFNKMREGSLRSENLAYKPADPAEPQSFKFRRGRAHVAFEELSNNAYIAAVETLNGLRDDVRDMFHRRARTCYILGTKSASYVPSCQG